MPDSPEPFICYGEAFPIAGGKLAMDAALNPRERNSAMPVLPKPRPIRRLARDEEGNTDYAALISFLEDKLEAGDLAKVRRMLGLDNPDLQGEPGGASDTAIAYDAILDREAQALQSRYRAGYISEGALVTGIRAINARRRTKLTAQDGKPVEGPLDKLEREFPHMGRLKR